MATTLAFACLAFYLAVSGVVLAAGGHGALAIVHATGLLASGAVLRHLRRGNTVDAWIEIAPLFVWPFLYFELPALIAALGSSYHDALVQRWELTLFHSQPSHVLAATMPFTLVSEALHAGYLAYYPVIFLPPVTLLFHEDRRALSQTMLALALTYFVCWTTYALFPVEGPRYLWQAPVNIPEGPVRHAVTRILAGGSSRGAAFPSSHMAVATVQAMMATRWQRGWSYVLWIIALLIGAGAVYGGFHYATDIIAGALLAAIVSTVVTLPMSRRD